MKMAGKMFSVMGASFWRFVPTQQAMGMRLSLAKRLMESAPLWTALILPTPQPSMATP